MTMLLLEGWKRQASISAPTWSRTERRQVRVPTCHKQIVPSREQLTIKSLAADQSQPVQTFISNNEQTSFKEEK